MCSYTCPAPESLYEMLLLCSNVAKIPLYPVNLSMPTPALNTDTETYRVYHELWAL